MIFFYHACFVSREKRRRTHVARRVLSRPDQQAHVHLRAVCGHVTPAGHPRRGTTVARRDFPEHVRGIVGIQSRHGRVRGGAVGFQGELFRRFCGRGRKNKPPFLSGNVFFIPRPSCRFSKIALWSLLCRKKVLNIESRSIKNKTIFLRRNVFLDANKIIDILLNGLRKKKNNVNNKIAYSVLIFWSVQC